jgi:hypothetical protein
VQPILVALDRIVRVVRRRDLVGILAARAERDRTATAILIDRRGI